MISVLCMRVSSPLAVQAVCLAREEWGRYILPGHLWFSATCRTMILGIFGLRGKSEEFSL